jgi:hypothetical protein
MKAYKITLGAFLFSMLVLLNGCPTTSPPCGLPYEEWISKFPEGFKKQVEVARAAAEAYHYITDTSITNLQSDEVAQQTVGELVTKARDKYRQWQSYGFYVVPSGPCYHNRVKFADGIYYVQGNEGEYLDFGKFSGWEARNGDELYDKSYDEGVILTSRGRPIFAGQYGKERVWKLMPPFDAILIGDRIADIPALIGQIKR